MVTTKHVGYWVDGELLHSDAVVVATRQHVVLDSRWWVTTQWPSSSSYKTTYWIVDGQLLHSDPVVAKSCSNRHPVYI